MLRPMIATLLLLCACGGDGGEGGTTDDSALPSVDCAPGCEDTVAAACPNGPADQATCVSDCEELLAGSCGSVYEELVTCEGTVSCDATYGYPVVEGCEAEQGAFLDCING